MTLPNTGRIYIVGRPIKLFNNCIVNIVTSILFLCPHVRIPRQRKPIQQMSAMLVLLLVLVLLLLVRHPKMQTAEIVI